MDPPFRDGDNSGIFSDAVASYVIEATHKLSFIISIYSEKTNEFFFEL